MVLDQLIEKARAVGDATAPGDKFKAGWLLLQFLSETPGIDLYISTSTYLSRVEMLLTEEDKAEMRKLGCSFPEDWDNPRELMGR